MNTIKFVLKGRPSIKKNGRPIHRKGRKGPHFLGKSKKLRGAEYNAKADLEEQMRWKRGEAQFPLTEKLHVAFLFYRDTRTGADLSNLYEIAQDALQAAGVIVNDAQIESHDGSRKLYDAKNPRTEIYISPFVKRYSIDEERTSKQH